MCAKKIKKSALQLEKELNELLKQKIDLHQLDIYKFRKLLNKDEEEAKSVEKFHEKNLEIKNRQMAINSEMEKELNYAKEQIKHLQLRLHNLIINIDPSNCDQLSIERQIQFKDQVIDCLQDLLVKVRLKIAENQEILDELDEEFKMVEKDVEVMTKNYNEYQALKANDFDWIEQLEKHEAEYKKTMDQFRDIKSEIYKIKTQFYDSTIFDRKKSHTKLNLKLFNSKDNADLRRELKICQESANKNVEELNELQSKLNKLSIQKELNERKFMENKEIIESLDSLIREKKRNILDNYGTTHELWQANRQMQEKMTDFLSK